MGLPIDIVEKKELGREIEQYLQNDYLNVIFLLTEPMIEKSAADPEYKELLENSDYLLPAGKSILEACPEKPSGEADIFTDYSCFLEISKEYLSKEKHFANNVYYIGKTKEEIQALVDFTAEQCPWLTAQGMYCEGMEEKDDLLVNEINAVAPDILITALESPFQEEWVIKNSTKLNARLCIGIGAVLQELLKKEEKKGLSGWFSQKRKRLSEKIRFHSFQKKVKRYRSEETKKNLDNGKNK
jgi:N-acetylglucosaminyldiphosphoundecaprenol N-acetyl-beta-D-mannosaminyltransferase